jgi:phage N-6-adenine-methyltransferase
MNRQTPMLTENDVRETPPALFASQDARFHFTLDACATHQNAKCPQYFTQEGLWRGTQERRRLSEDNGLTGSWAGERVWCNPPYSDIGAWVLKAWESRAELVCMLVPATRTEQDWWQDGVEPYRDGRADLSELGWNSLRLENLRGRQHFLKDGKPILNPKTGKRSSPKFGCCLLIWS